MDHYLVRHGEARSEREDPARSLSERGFREVERVARVLARSGLGVIAIRHSGKLRARQTADVLARALAPPEGVSEMAGLAPDDDPAIAMQELDAASGPTMLVGHLPHLSRLASLLLLRDSTGDAVPLQTGEVVSLTREDGTWRLCWALTPGAIPEV